MLIAYYFDESVNRMICLGLRLRGVDVITVQEDGKQAADDNKILGRAIALNRPLVTADQDFLAIASTRLRQANLFPGVIFLRPQISIGDAVETLEIYAKAGEPKDFINKVTYL
ncbi:MAG: DUF5615 family PIN-like protein [Leptolyngbyaceae cyanobacterium SL_5_9]|nr:DUF5615 family PIN-like protein [Leptolyngbyaceae cyanobacterium SL_5_9]